jgi:tetratricopeptide (TPR) repeat protein
VKPIGKLAAMAAAIALGVAGARADVSLTTLAKRGDAEAQYLLGKAYLEGREVPRDPSEGIRWLRHASGQGHAEARFVLATLYREGRGTPQNLPAAARLLSENVADRHLPSEVALAEMYAAGEGVARDDALAVKLLDDAAWRNYPEAQARLGERFYHGRGVPQDRRRAWLLLMLSGDAIRPEGRAMLEEIDRGLDETERSTLLRTKRAFEIRTTKLVERVSPLRNLPVLDAAEPARPAPTEAEPESLPAEALARLERAESLLDQGTRENDTARVAEAVSMADAVLGEDPSNARALLIRGRGDLAAGRDAEATERLRAAAAQRPEWAEAHFWLGTALERQGRWSEARDALGAALRFDPDRTEARAGLVRVLLAMGDREAAVTHARLYLAEEPGDTAVRDVLVETLVALGRERDALRILQEILPEDRDAVAWAAMGRIYLDLGENRRAREALVRADVDAPHRAETLGALLRLDIAEGRLPESLARIDAALARSPGEPALHRLAGIAALHDGRGADAEASFRRALELDPGDVESAVRLGRYYTESGRADEAVRLYRRTLETASDAAILHHRLGQAYEARGDRGPAIGSYEEASRRDPGFGPAKDDLARLLADDPRSAARALSLAEEARALMPSEPGPAITLGKLNLAQDEVMAAIRYLQRAEARLELGDPRLGEVRYLLGRSYVADGQIARGRETLEQALSGIDSGDASEPAWAAGAREILARLAPRG